MTILGRPAKAGAAGAALKPLIIAVGCTLGLLGAEGPWLRCAHAAGNGSAAASSNDAPALLRRVQDATQKRNYAGIFVVNTGNSMISSRVVHYFDARGQIERLEILDGQARRVYRQNEVVHVVWPKERAASIEPREPVGAFPTPWPSDMPLSPDLYDLLPGGADRIANWDAQVWTFRPRDTWRYGLRVWLEPQSGLLLRADTLGERGEVLESSAYSELQIGVRPQFNALQQEMQRLDGLHVAHVLIEPSDLDREGWTFKPTTPGFQLQRCLRRPLTGRPRPHAGATTAPGPGKPEPGAPVAAAPASTLLQAVFTDGLTQVSVFIEPFDAQLHKRGTPAVLGATHALSQRQGDWWITAVGDVPMLTLQHFLNAMERKKS